MKKINIAEELKHTVKEFKVGVISFTCSVEKTSFLNEIIFALQEEIKTNYSLSDVLKITNIEAARKGYKLLGKDPSRYRLAVESLFRRIVKGNELYRINDVVDLGNILSLKTMRSVAVLDEDKIEGDILIRIGQNEAYEGIGRGNINIENIPVYCDQIGPFGTPTSDTMRTMITNETKKVLIFIISFNGEKGLIEDIKLCMDLYQKYASGTEFIYKII
ncbi:hypothetical protein KHQ81_03625 [Mycoplasmatota bacterium]|nr:hypothetical protein KHQ81_03625 [Mycoplasmatota bacterium]